MKNECHLCDPQASLGCDGLVAMVTLQLCLCNKCVHQPQMNSLVADWMEITFSNDCCFKNGFLSPSLTPSLSFVVFTILHSMAALLLNISSSPFSIPSIPLSPHHQLAVSHPCPTLTLLLPLVSLPFTTEVNELSQPQPESPPLPTSITSA